MAEKAAGCVVAPMLAQLCRTNAPLDHTQAMPVYTRFDEGSLRKETCVWNSRIAA
jgi:hypothetical protein